ncbi:MAG: ABC transporter permease subunit [Enhygromyxa sp.]
MRRFWTLLKLDAKLAARHKLVHVTVVIAALFGLLIAFVFPAELAHDTTDYLLDATEDGRFAALIEAAPGEAVMSDEQALREAVAGDSTSLGVKFSGTPEAPSATVYLQGNEGPRRRALIETGVDAMWQHVGMARPATPPTVLDPGAEKPPFNQLLIPILFAVDLCVLGFMFGAVMILQDKQHGTVRVFRVGPGTGLDYVASKLSVNLGLSLLNLLILVGLGAPWALAEPGLIPLVLLTCAGMTLLGMGLAVFFRSIAQFFFPLAAVGLLGAMPMYLVFTPAPALAWTACLPTYHVLFGAEAIMFSGEQAVIRAAFSFCSLFALVAAGFCGAAVYSRLMREGD